MDNKAFILLVRLMNTKSFFYLMLIGLSMDFAYSQSDTLIIKYSKITPIVDGEITSNEWRDADSVFINRADNWSIKILFKYDYKNLYVAFINLEADTNRNISEILFDPDIKTDTVWRHNTLWFHASYSDCFKAGNYYDWSTCSKTKSDWSVNNLDFEKGYDNMEYQISLSKLSLYNIGRNDNVFRIAFVLDNKYRNIKYWPDYANISNPSTWGYAKFQVPNKK